MGIRWRAAVRGGVGVFGVPAALVLSLLTASSSAGEAEWVSAVVSPANGSGWALRATGDSTVGFAWGPSATWSGSGSAELRVEDGTTGAELLNGGYDGTYLSSLTELTYVSYVERNRSAEAVYVVLDVDYDGDDVADDLLYFEPAYQDVDTFPAYPQGPPRVGEWQWWDALWGGWWSREGTAGAGPGIDVKPLWDVIREHPDARIVRAAGHGGVRLAAGFGGPGSWTGFAGAVDSVSIGVDGDSTHFDFEVDRDADGHADPEDACPQSDLRPLVDVNGPERGATGLANTVDETGRSLQDRVRACEDAAPNHATYVLGVREILHELQAQGVLTPDEVREIDCSASRSSVGTYSE
jgi:hypothetical protein